MSKVRQSNIAMIFFLLLAVVFYCGSSSIAVDGDYPKIVSIGLLVLSAIGLAQSFIETRGAGDENARTIGIDAMTTEELAEHMVAQHEEHVPAVDIAAVMGISLISLFLWESIGFIFAGAAAIMALSLLKKRPIFKSLIISVATVLVIQLIFRNIFSIPIPSPSWWPYF